MCTPLLVCSTIPLAVREKRWTKPLPGGPRTARPADAGGGKAARASARRKPPDAATKNESPPVKRHRGEPGHTRDTRAHKQVGSRSDAPYDRVTGAGDSSPRTTDSTPTPLDADALSKGVGVSLLVAETTGALAASFMTILRLLARQTRLPGATDNTRYGEGRASPRSFLTHHVANISTAIQTADAQTILNAASARMLRVSFGVM